MAESGELDRRLQQFAPGQAAEALVGQGKAGHRARKADGQRPVNVAVVGHAWPAEQIGIGCCPGLQGKRTDIEGAWRGGAEIDRGDICGFAPIA